MSPRTTGGLQLRIGGLPGAVVPAASSKVSHRSAIPICLAESVGSYAWCRREERHINRWSKSPRRAAGSPATTPFKRARELRVSQRDSGSYDDCAECVILDIVEQSDTTFLA